MSKDYPIYPTLSERGFISSTEGILSEILSNYYLTDEQQELVYRKEIISLPKTYFRHINNPEAFKDRVLIELETLLKFHFEVVEVQGEVRIDPANGTRANIAIFASVVDSYGEKFSLGKVNRVTEEGFDFTKVIDILNYGDRHQYMGF